MREFSSRLGVILFTAAVWVAQTTLAVEPDSARNIVETHSVWQTIGLAFAAALAVSVSILGAGYAVGRIGSAAMGAAAENPELLNRSFLFVALAEGLAVLGFVIAIMILQKI